MPYSGLPYFLSSQAGGKIGLTFDQSASSSSAMIAGTVVKVPCPISAAGDTMVTVPSGVMVSQALGESGASALASSRPMTHSGAMVSARVRPAVERRKSRRLILVCEVMAQPSRAARWIALMILR
jgi:hypothetical protein